MSIFFCELSSYIYSRQFKQVIVFAPMGFSPVWAISCLFISPFWGLKKSLSNTKFSYQIRILRWRSGNQDLKIRFSWFGKSGDQDQLFLIFWDQVEIRIRSRSGNQTSRSKCSRILMIHSLIVLKLYTHGSVLHNVIRKCQKYEILTKIVKAYL